MKTRATSVIEQGQVGMFGYGSLLCKSSMELTLGRTYPQTPKPCSLKGWQRSWNVVMPNSNFYDPMTGVEFVPANILYLNITPGGSAPVNGLLYVLTDEEMEAFDRREWIYDRTRVTSSLRDLDVEGGEVYTYVAKAEWILDRTLPREWAAIRKTYLELIDKGLEELGPNFASGYELSTEPLPNERVFSDLKRNGTHPLLAETQQSARYSPRSNT